MPLTRKPYAWRQSVPTLLLVVAVLTSAWAWSVIAFPMATLSNMERHAGHFALVFAHMVGGTLMLFLGAMNLYVGSTRRYFRHHKLVGYSYLLGGTAGSVFALLLAITNVHNEMAAPLALNRLDEINERGFALGALAVAWLLTAGFAYRAARNRRYDTHRAWMIRSYVLTWSFVLCNLLSRVPALSELGDGTAMIWLTWVGAFFICEIVLQWRAGARLPQAVSGPQGANNSFKPNPLRGSA